MSDSTHKKHHSCSAKKHERTSHHGSSHGSSHASSSKSEGKKPQESKSSNDGGDGGDGGSSGVVSAPAGIHGLQFITWDDQYDMCPEITPDSSDFAILAAIMSCAIQLLESPKGNATMIQLGQEFAANWKHGIFKGDVTKMDKYKDIYVRGLRRNFPSVYMDNADPELNDRVFVAMVHPEQPALAEVDWDNYDPKKSFRIRLCGSLVKSILENNRQDLKHGTPPLRGKPARKLARTDWKKEVEHRWLEYLFFMADTVAHELCHGFKRFLNHNSELPEARTPPPVNVADRMVPDDPVGESGWWWEGKMWGGTIDIFYNPSRDSSTVGDMYICHPDDTATRVTPGFMQRVMDNPKGYTEPPTEELAKALKTEELDYVINTRARQSTAKKYSYMKYPADWFDNFDNLVDYQYSVSGAELQRAASHVGVIIKATRHHSRTYSPSGSPSHKKEKP